MKIEPFVMEVTPHQSEIVQKVLFYYGYMWGGNDNSVQHLNKPYLFFQLVITFSTFPETFRNSGAHLTFEEFSKLYAVKYLRKEKLKQLENKV